MLKRKIYQKMLDWKQNSRGTSALMIEGARRVGKSYIVETFTKHPRPDGCGVWMFVIGLVR